MATNSRSNATESTKSSNNNDKPASPTTTTRTSAPANPTSNAASRSQLSDRPTSPSASPSTSQSSNATLADFLSSTLKSGAASSPSIEVFDVLSTATQRIHLASPTSQGTTTRLSSSSASVAATPTPGSPPPSTTAAMGSAARHPVKLVPEEARIHAIEERYGEMTSSCYELPITSPDGKKALAVIPGMFNPCVPRKTYIFGDPATVHPRHISFQKPIWAEYGWARQENLTGYGSDSRPPPEHIGPNVTNDELDAEPILCFQIETLRYIPEWGSDYPFAMLYDPILGFAFPLVDLHEEAKLGGSPLPFPNHWEAQYLGLAFAPFDPFDMPSVDPRVESTPWGQHPARIGKLNREIGRREAEALAAVMRIFG